MHDRVCIRIRNVFKPRSIFDSLHRNEVSFFDDRAWSIYATTTRALIIVANLMTMFKGLTPNEACQATNCDKCSNNQT